MSRDTNRWWLILKEVRRQAARHIQAAGLKELEGDGVWYDVKESMNVPSGDLEPVADSGRWQQLQWLNAFQVLVRRIGLLLIGHHCRSSCLIAVSLTVGVFRSSSFLSDPIFVSLVTRRMTFYSSSWLTPSPRCVLKLLCEPTSAAH